MTKQEDSGHSFLAYFKRATSPLAVLRILSKIDSSNEFVYRP